MNDTLLLIGRLLLAQLFLLAGIGKLGAGYAATQGYMTHMGVSALLLPLVVFAEVGGGLALVLGFLTRWAALGLAIFSVASALLFHINFADQGQLINFQKNLAIAGGLLVLFVYGAGAYSLDSKWSKYKS